MSREEEIKTYLMEAAKRFEIHIKSDFSDIINEFICRTGSKLIYGTGASKGFELTECSKAHVRVLVEKITQMMHEMTEIAINTPFDDNDIQMHFKEKAN